MGGGVVGVEMSQAYCSLGAQVTLIEGERRLLPREEEFACEQVTESLEEQGVDIRTGQKATGGPARRATRSPSRSATAATATGDELLVAVGRTPQADGPRARDASAWRPDGYIEVDAARARPRASTGCT